MPWWIWTLVCNLCAVTIECMNHGAGHGATWISVLPKTIWPIVLLQYALYRAWSEGEHILVVWAIFMAGNAVMRVLAVRFFFMEEIGSWWLVGLGTTLLVAGSYAINLGKMTPS
jgi:hypothetical protein